jgi:hypothetical protein
VLTNGFVEGWRQIFQVSYEVPALTESPRKLADHANLKAVRLFIWVAR